MTNLLWCSIVILVFIIVILMFYIKKSKEKYRILEMYNEQLLEGCREQNKEYIKMENEIPQFKYFATSLRTFKDYKAINILENKKGHWYIVMEMYSDDSLEFWLSGKRHKAISDCPRLFSTIRNTHIW
ncbi:MAG: hypothetical protein IJ324_10235, partial [Lachnospiraceae bacterium]|nr:hypothetical protein [Lachnospiraceae bacterium]